jgi:death on curing protein
LPTNRATEEPPEPVWIEFGTAVTLHDSILKHWGGGHGFPNPNYLESAIHAPKNAFFYLGGGCDLFDLAAAYVFHVAKAHAFTDGNKRTAYITALYFLYLNGVEVQGGTNELAFATERAVKDEIGKSELAVVIWRMAGSPKRRFQGKTGRRKKSRKRML